MRPPSALLAAALLATLPVAPGFAGDAAQLEILGFSKDGGVFAFEEYGVQDGSGFPYANRYYIDTTTDTFVKGTPVRVRLHPADCAAIEALGPNSALPERVDLVPDPRLERGDAVTEYDDGALDARISTALDRARRALSGEEPL